MDVSPRGFVTTGNSMATTLVTPLSSPPVSRPEQMFPTLTPAQIARIAAHGQRAPIARGEVLVEAGDRAVPFFVVTRGAGRDRAAVADGARRWSPSTARASSPARSTCSRAAARWCALRVAEPGEVIELDREQLLALVQTDAELSEILMRAFILRRVELIAQRPRRRRAGRLGPLRRHAARQGVPDPQRPSLRLHRSRPRRRTCRSCSIASTSTRGGRPGRDLPRRGRCCATRPTEQIADCLGFNDAIDADAGPRRGRSSAPARRASRPRCTRASEGLDVLVLESNAPGGQAGSSSKIENYLGFPTGISGQELAGRAYTQAQKFGAQVMIAQGRDASSPATASRTRSRSTTARACRRATVIIATGAEYRQARRSTNLSQFEGAGVYYGATFMEAQLCARRGGHRRRRRQLGRPGGGVPGADAPARAHARPRRAGWPTPCRAI